MTFKTFLASFDLNPNLARHVFEEILAEVNLCKYRVYW